MTTGLPARARPVARPAARGYRPDVEGLRAVAVVLVLLYHAGVPGLSGGFVGVDVFFVISGFLITGLLVRELEATGRVSLTTFYGRRAKRLLPAAGVVLVATLVATLLFVPVVDWRAFGGDMVAAALYVVNWRLAARSVDYLAEDTGVSVVQHFWSLAVEEQFYVVWPLLILLAAWWVRRSGWPLRPTLAAGLALVAVPSLGWSVYLTAADPARAFFVTPTRLWELAVGAAVALAVPHLHRVPGAVAPLLGWLGLAAVVVAGVGYSTGTPWPGYAALLPTLGTAAVIAAGPSAGGSGPVAVLGRPAFVAVGGLSYSLYLWHWPAVVAAEAWTGGLSPAAGLAVVAASTVPAWLTHRLLENPVRYSVTLARRPRRALAVGAGFTAVGVAAGAALLLAVPTAAAPATGQAPGARVLDAPTAGGSEAPAEAGGGAADGGETDGGTDPAGGGDGAAAQGITPDPLLATEDLPAAYADDCQVDAVTSEPVVCAYGDTGASRVIALVGDSKALQWLPALDVVGVRRGWRVETWTKSACPFSAATVSLDGDPYTSCTAWNERVAAELAADPPEVLVTSQVRGTALESGEESAAAMVEGLRRQWRPLVERGTQVVVLQDNQNPGFEVYACVAENLDDPAGECGFERGTSPTRRTLADAASGQQGVRLVDLTAAICPTPTCPPVVGGVLVYRQGSHLTATYVESLAPRVDAALADLLAGGGPP